MRLNLLSNIGWTRIGTTICYDRLFFGFNDELIIDLPCDLSKASVGLLTIKYPPVYLKYFFHFKTSFVFEYHKSLICFVYFLCSVSLALTYFFPSSARNKL